jgi:hypothetical protein
LITIGNVHTILLRNPERTNQRNRERESFKTTALSGWPIHTKTILPDALLVVAFIRPTRGGAAFINVPEKYPVAAVV